MNKPSFEINDKIINLIAEINNKLGYLEANFNNKKNLLLRKASKIRSVNSSCAIEANTLTVDEVESIINGKRVMAPPVEIMEVKNAYEAYSKIETFNPYDIDAFLSAHKFLTNNLVDDSGMFRTGDVAVYENNTLVHLGARPQFVLGLISNLFNWAKSTSTNALIKACVVHYEIETIHPFSDGNGRIGRLWQSVILYNYNRIFEIIPIETLVYENQQEYYRAIEKSRVASSSTSFIEYMLEMISKTIDISTRHVTSTIQIKREYLKELSNSELQILESIVENFALEDFITVDKISSKVSKASSSLRLYLRKFVNLGILIAIGEKKGRKYKINREILK